MRKLLVSVLDVILVKLEKYLGVVFVLMLVLYYEAMYLFKYFTIIIVKRKE